MRAPFTENETTRLAALAAYKVLDTPPEEVFDALTRTAAHLFEAPVAMVSLVDKDRQWFKSRVGLDACETHRDVAFCAHAILTSEPTVVPDARLDPRFSDNALVTGEPGIRFYVGVPLETQDGQRLGTLCVIDFAAREAPPPAQVKVLQDLAGQVVSQLEFRLAREELRSAADSLLQREHELAEAQRQRARSEARAKLALEAGQMGSWEFDAKTGTAIWSDMQLRLFGKQGENPEQPFEAWLACVLPEDRGRMVRELEEHKRGLGQFALKYRILRSGEIRWIEERGAASRSHSGEFIGATAVAWDVTGEHEAAEERERLLAERGAVLSCTATGLIEFDTAGRCIFANPRALELLARTESECLGRGLDEVLGHTRAGGTPWPQRQNPILRTLQTRQAARSDAELFRRSTGTAFEVEYHANPLIPQDNVTGVVVSFLDIAERKRQETERAELLRELRDSVHDLGRVQMAMIGSTPEACQLKVDLCFHPKHAAGGDFLCHFHLPGDREMILLTDVSGHDLRAAYYAAYSHGMVRAMLDHGVPPKGVLEGLNLALLRQNSGNGGIGTSMAALAIVYDHNHASMSVKNCGSPSPVYVDADGVPQVLQSTGSYPLGWFPQVILEAAAFSVKGGFLLMWTDGLEDLASNLKLSSFAMAAALIQEKEAESGCEWLAGAQDDVMAALIRWPGDNGPILNRWMPVLDEQYPAHMSERIDELQERWTRNIEFLVPGIRDASLFDIVLCTREALLTWFPAGGPEEEARLSLRYHPSRGRIRVSIAIPGDCRLFHMEFDHEMDVPNERRGLYLIRQFAHHVRTSAAGDSIEMEFDVWATTMLCNQELEAITPPA